MKPEMLFWDTRNYRSLLFIQEPPASRVVQVLDPVPQLPARHNCVYNFANGKTIVIEELPGLSRVFVSMYGEDIVVPK